MASCFHEGCPEQGHDRGSPTGTKIGKFFVSLPVEKTPIKSRCIHSKDTQSHEHTIPGTSSMLWVRACQLRERAVGMTFLLQQLAVDIGIAPFWHNASAFLAGLWADLCCIFRSQVARQLFPVPGSTRVQDPRESLYIQATPGSPDHHLPKSRIF